VTNFFVIAAPNPALAPVTKTVIDMPPVWMGFLSRQPGYKEANPSEPCPPSS
jgi:hypothetical protein